MNNTVLLGLPVVFICIMSKGIFSQSLLCPLKVSIKLSFTSIMSHFGHMAVFVLPHLYIDTKYFKLVIVQLCMYNVY